MQLGVTPDLEDVPDESSKSKNRAKLIYGLQNVGFESMHAYEEVSLVVTVNAVYSSHNINPITSICLLTH